MNQFYYIDTYSQGAFHEDFNATSLKMFSCVHQSIEYYAFPSSKKEVTRILGGKLPQNVNYHPLREFKFKKFKGFLEKLYSNFLNIFLISTLPKQAEIFVNYNCLWATKLISFFLSYRPQKNVTLMFHGELENLYTERKVNFLSQKSLNLLKSKKFMPPNNLRFCVLGESIYNNLSNIIAPHLISHFWYFEHTLIPKQYNQISRTGTKLKIGFVGSIHPIHGLSNMLRLCEILKGYNDIEISAIGRIICSYSQKKELLSLGINIKKEYGSDFIPTDVLEKEIKKLDIIVFVYPERDYKYTASGALLTAISFGKTIYSLKNDYFNSIFKREKIGIQFNYIEDMAVQLIQDIQSFSRYDYETSQFTPEEEAKSLIFLK